MIGNRICGIFISDQSHALSILLLLYKKNRISCASPRQPPAPAQVVKSLSISSQVSLKLKILHHNPKSSKQHTSTKMKQPKQDRGPKNSRPKFNESRKRRRRFAATITLLIWCAARSICSTDTGVPQRRQSPAPVRPVVTSVEYLSHSDSDQ